MERLGVAQWRTDTRVDHGYVVIYKTDQSIKTMWREKLNYQI